MHIPRSRAWLITAMVFLFMLINFADKAVVGLSAKPIMKELGIDRAQFGMLGSSFFFLFAISGVIVGFAANKISVKLLMLVMATLWALLVLPLAFGATFALLVTTRIMLGAAEGPAFPLAMHAVHKWFPDNKRGVPTSVVACGAAFGTGVVAPGIAWIISNYSWHAAFGTLGVVGLLWAAVWLIVGSDGTVDDEPDANAATAQRVPTMQLLTCRTALGVYLAGFAAYWILSLNIIWLADYLGDGLGLTLGEAAWVIALASGMQIVLAPSLAYMSNRLTRRGVPTRFSRGLTGAACVIVAGLALVLMAQVELGPLKILLIGLSFSIGSVIFTLGTMLMAEISPPAQRGGALGLTNSLHTVAGVVAPTVMGWVVNVSADPAHGFATGFRWAGLGVVVAGVVAAFLINPNRDLERFRRPVTPESASPVAVPAR